MEKHIYVINNLKKKIDLQNLKKDIKKNKIKKVMIEEIVALDGSTDALYACEVLRELTSIGLVLDWRLENINFDIRKIRHIFPPKDIITDSNGELNKWKKIYCYGLLHYRKGPDFILIEDKRSGKHKLNYTIGDITILNLINNENVIGNIQLNEKERAALRLLSKYELVLMKNEKFIFLPYRLQ